MNDKKLLVFVILFIISAMKLNAQAQDYKLGADLIPRYSQSSGFFDFSDPEAVNIKVAVWGFVRYPGKYVVPIYTNVSDLLSYAGGPTDAAHLDDLRLFRTNADSTQQLIKLHYDDVMWEDNLTTKFKRADALEAGDILVVPGAPRIYTREAVGIWISILSALISLSILVLNIVRN